MHKKKFFLITTVLLQSLYSQNYVKNNSNLAERTPYSIPLVKLSLMKDRTAIRISKNDDDYAIIGLLDDVIIKNTKDKKTTVTFREFSNQAHYLSDFEARYLIIVSQSLVAALEELERNLQQKKWGQCLYLDAFLPKFLRNFYMLIGITQNNVFKYSDIICTFEQKFDISLSSPRSDERISLFKNDNDRLLKLRIASKEVAYQLRLWEKKELSNTNRNLEISLSTKVEESLEFFIKIYFGISSSDTCKPGGTKKTRKRT
jgi:hypothetical protein